MPEITNIWFKGDHMYGGTADGKIYRQSLMWYPRLYFATKEQRNRFFLGIDGVHWREINEDIGFDSFIERNGVEPDKIQRFFLTRRELNVTGIAHILGISPSLLHDYIYGWKKPSPEHRELIRKGMHQYAVQLAQATAD